MPRFLQGAAIAAMLLGSSVANSEPVDLAGKIFYNAVTYFGPNDPTSRAELASALHLYDNECEPIGPDLGLAARTLVMRTTPDRFREANQKLGAEMRRIGVLVWCETYQPMINDMKRKGGIDWR